MLSIPGSCGHVLPLSCPVQARGTPVGLQELCSCLGRLLSAEPPLTKPHGQGKLPTAAPVWERVSNKPGSSRVMLCANSSEALSRILLCWLCFFPPDPATAALLPSGLPQERLLTWLVQHGADPSSSKGQGMNPCIKQTIPSCFYRLFYRTLGL